MNATFRSSAEDVHKSQRCYWTTSALTCCQLSDIHWLQTKMIIHSIILDYNMIIMMFPACFKSFSKDKVGSSFLFEGSVRALWLVICIQMFSRRGCWNLIALCEPARRMCRNKVCKKITSALQWSVLYYNSTPETNHEHINRWYFPHSLLSLL